MSQLYGMSLNMISHSVTCHPTQVNTPHPVLVVQWLSVGLVMKRSLVRLPAGALSSQLGQLSLPSLRRIAGVPACMAVVKAGCVHLCRVAGNTV